MSPQEPEQTTPCEPDRLTPLEIEALRQDLREAIDLADELGRAEGLPPVRRVRPSNTNPDSSAPSTE